MPVSSRFTADAGFAVALVAIPVALDMLLPWVEFRFLPEGILRGGAYVWTWGPVALACMVLAACRPRHWALVGLAIPTIFAAASLVHFVLLFHTPVSALSQVHLMDAREDVGLGALVGYSLVGALIGRGVRPQSVKHAFAKYSQVPNGR